MKNLTIGVLAHVDAGKTTLIEQLLVASGRRKEAGRVDHGTSFLDTDAQERARGITITSKMCHLPLGNLMLTVLDTPGHVDFTAESERVLPVLNTAVLLIGAGEKVPAHARYLFRLLQERGIPTAIFFNKMDLPGADRKGLLQQLTDTLGEGFADWYGDPAERAEAAAVLDEEVLERYLREGSLLDSDFCRLFRRGTFHPCCFGSALQGEGIDELLGMLGKLLDDQTADIIPADACGEKAERKSAEESFGAYCYKVLYDASGQKQCFIKILSGKLSVRETVNYIAKDEVFSEKVTQLRRYDGASYEALPSAEKGEIVAVTGLSAVSPGSGLGAAPSAHPESSRPMLRFRLILPEGTDPRPFLQKLRVLEEEEPTLAFDWSEGHEEITVALYGEVQKEILTERIRERCGITVSFDAGSVVYRETLEEPSYGVGHFEPLRHYAEVHFLLEPLPRGTGILLESSLSTDELDRSWQQTILSAVENEPLTGVLTNARLTDLRITLAAGRAHKKHTEGGDFREAALRAIRQGLMAGKPMLLEPYVRFTLTVPQEAAGRALYDMGQLAEESRITEQTEKETTLEGRGALSKLRNYMAEVRTYTHGEGLFRMLYDGYDRCANPEDVIEACGYDAERDLLHPASSVFVDHGAAALISWQDAPEWMHIEPRYETFYPGEEEQKEVRPRMPLSERLEAIGTDEIDAILQQATHANESKEHASERRNRWARANGRRDSDGLGDGEKSQKTARKAVPERKPYLLVDGYNILHAWEETRELVQTDLTAARGVLLDMLTDYRAVTTPEIIVVFDAYRVPGHRTEAMDYGNLHVVFTREAETADQYIARFATEHEKKYDITVATSDGMIQLIIRGADARLLSARDLRDAVRMKKEELREQYRL